jgi:hypothetical protein
MPWRADYSMRSDGEEVYFTTEELAKEFVSLWATYAQEEKLVIHDACGFVIDDDYPWCWYVEEVSQEEFDEEFPMEDLHRARPTIYTSAETAFEDWKTNPYLPMGCPNGLPGSEKQALRDPEAWLRFVVSQQSLTPEQSRVVFMVLESLSTSIIANVLTCENSRKLLFIAEEHGRTDNDSLVLENFPIYIIDHYKTDLLHYIDKYVFNFGYDYWMWREEINDYWTYLCKFYIKNFPDAFSEFVGTAMVPRLTTGETKGIVAMLGLIVSLDQTILIKYANDILDAVNEIKYVDDAWSYLGEYDEQCPPNQDKILLLQYWLFTVTE